MRDRGFTLIEMMAVVVIMALLATGAALSFKRPLQAARARDAADQVRALDSSARQFARRFGRPVKVAFDLSSHSMTRRDHNAVVFQTTLPRACQIDEVRFSDRSESLGEVEVEFSTMGLSRSYALHLVGPEFDQWIVFAGLTGQVTQVNDVSKLDAIFPQSAARDDTD